MQKIFQYKKAIPLFLLLCGCMAGCAPWKIVAEHNVVKNGISFESFSEREYSSGDSRYIGTMTEDTVIDGWPCAKEFVEFYPDWRLDKLHLSRDYERNGVFMPAGTKVLVNEEGNPGTCEFPYDVEIQGHLCRGGMDWMTGFYPSGKLASFYTKDSVVIDGVTCKGKSWFLLHENGRQKFCVLAEPYRIEGEEFPNGVTCKEDGPVFFDENGRFAGCVLNEPLRIEGKDFQKGDVFLLDPEGKRFLIR